VQSEAGRSLRRGNLLDDLSQDGVSFSHRPQGCTITPLGLLPCACRLQAHGPEASTFSPRVDAIDLAM
jgi:hypothetical protein